MAKIAENNMEKEIIEGNKLIANFMGWTYDYSGVKWAVPIEKDLIPKTENYVSGTRLFDNELKFDKNWNWLMAVIDRIEGMADVTIKNNHCEICSVDSYSSPSVFRKTRIEHVWFQVVHFIGWYNRTNNK